MEDFVTDLTQLLTPDLLEQLAWVIEARVVSLPRGHTQSRSALVQRPPWKKPVEDCYDPASALQPPLEPPPLSPESEGLAGPTIAALRSMPPRAPESPRAATPITLSAEQLLALVDAMRARR
mgnify:CR=1 FL=1